jgi:Protein of unknown function (DUF4245)
MAGRKPRGRETAYDMVLSMGAVLASVAIILVITHRSHQQVMPPVDYAGAVALAQTQTQLAIEVPTPLPSGYEVTSARFEAESYGATGDVRWYLGYQTPAREYVSLWQSTGPAGRVVGAATNGAVCDGTVVILHETWKTCQKPKPLNRAIVRVQGHVTTVVSGTASFAELKAFAGTLQPPKK